MEDPYPSQTSISSYTATASKAENGYSGAWSHVIAVLPPDTAALPQTVLMHQQEVLEESSDDWCAGWLAYSIRLEYAAKSDETGLNTLDADEIAFEIC